MKQAIKYMLLASFLFALMLAIAKQLSSNISSVEIVFFRNLFGVIIILYSIYKIPLEQKGGRLLLLIFRGTIGFLSLLTFFYVTSKIPLATAMTFSKTSAIFTALFAYIFLKEKLNYLGCIGVLIGFLGIACIVNFDILSLKKTDFLGILTGIGAAFAYTSIRELRLYYDNRTIVLSFVLIGTIGPAILMFIANFYQTQKYDFLISSFIMPNGFDWVLIILLGIVSTFAQLYMTKSYSVAKAGIVGTIGYSSILFSVIFGIFLGDIMPTFLIILGILLIVTSGVLVSFNK